MKFKQANIFGDRDQQNNPGRILTGMKKDSIAEVVPYIDLSVISMDAHIHINSSSYAFRFMCFFTYKLYLIFLKVCFLI